MRIERRVYQVQMQAANGSGVWHPFDPDQGVVFPNEAQARRFMARQYTADAQNASLAQEPVGVIYRVIGIPLVFSNYEPEPII